MLSVTATACSSDSESSTDTSADATTSTDSTTILPVEDRGVVTIRMAVVGEPGNPSVGVIQTFGGPPGNWVQPPKGTGIYKTCDDAPATQTSCLTVGSVDYEYGIGEYETTVSQYVTFLNTADPNGRNLRQLYIDNMSPTVWPQYGAISYASDANRGKHYSVAYPGMGEQAPQSRGLSPRGALRQLAHQRGRPVQEARDVGWLHLRRI